MIVERPAPKESRTLRVVTTVLLLVLLGPPVIGIVYSSITGSTAWKAKAEPEGYKSEALRIAREIANHQKAQAAAARDQARALQDIARALEKCRR